MKQRLSDKTIITIINETFKDKALIDNIYSVVDSDKNAYQLFYDNPYNFIRLLKPVYTKGFDFKKADLIASKFGFAPDSFERIRALLYFDLNNLLSDGSTIVEDYRVLVEWVVSHDRENLTHKRVEEVLRQVNGIVFHEDSVQFKRESHYEEVIADSVVDRIMDNEVYISDVRIDKAIRKVEESIGSDFKYDDSQVEAIRFAVQNRFVIITGGPGTGKTTTINGIIKVLRLLEKPRINLMAPTGRAASRMTEAIGLEASTIHSALSVPIYMTGDTVFENEYAWEREPYDYDLTVVDEFSMVDVGLAYHVFNQIPTSTRLICVGDVDQLEPVGHGQVLYDLMQNYDVPILRLSVIHRQGNGSMISELAKLTNNGDFPHVIGETSETFFRHTLSNFIDKAITEDYAAVISGGHYDAKDIQILTPVRAGNASVRSLNLAIQNYWLQQGTLSYNSVKCLGYEVRVGDRVMVTSNLDNGLTNGDIGYVTRLNGYESIYIEVPAPTGTGWRTYEIERIRRDGRRYFPIELAYAITTHKSQGGEFPLVLYALRPGVDYWAKRSALYTAITRAKKYLVMYGDVNTYIRLAKNEGNHRKTRLPWALSEKLEECLCDDF